MLSWIVLFLPGNGHRYFSRLLTLPTSDYNCEPENLKTIGGRQRTQRG